MNRRPVTSKIMKLKALEIVDTFNVPRYSFNASRSWILKQEGFLLPQMCGSNPMSAARYVVPCLLHLCGRIGVKLLFSNFPYVSLPARYNWGRVRIVQIRYIGDYDTLAGTTAGRCMRLLRSTFIQHRPHRQACFSNRLSFAAVVAHGRGIAAGTKLHLIRRN